MRVQIPAYTDRWMLGDRYGEVVKSGKNKRGIEVAHVRLDKSNIILAFVLDDCTVVS